MCIDIPKDMAVISAWSVIHFIVGLIISTIIIFIVTKVLSEKEGIKTALATAIIGSIIYGVTYFLFGNALLAAIIGGIAWLFSLKWLYKIGWLKSIVIAVIIWVITSIVGILLPTAPGPL
jgi:hypothetical protein